MSAVLTEPSAGPAVTQEQVRRAPKVLLHDHLDGGLRPATIVELAAEIGHTLPAPDAESLGEWFTTMADSGSLVKYLETFDHTVAVMQTVDGLSRVARECVEDLATDGVVYAEVRWAPEQHVQAGLTLDQVVEAVLSGFREGEVGDLGDPVTLPHADEDLPHGDSGVALAAPQPRRDRLDRGLDRQGV
jgi:adenosine deaminase